MNNKKNNNNNITLDNIQLKNQDNSNSIENSPELHKETIELEDEEGDNKEKHEN